jgi:hypothetical protein
MNKVAVVVIGVALTGLLVAGGAAFGDDDSDRADLLRNIDDRVDRMANKLSGFDSDRDASDLEDALRLASEVREMAQKLERVRGSDSRASEIASRYPGYVDTFRESARYLKKMKELQFVADGVADKCKNDEADLQTLIRNFVGRPDDAEEAFARLPDKSKEYGRTWSERLDRLKESDREFSSNHSSARFSVSDGKWSNVSSYFSDDASRMRSYWQDRYRAASEGSCPRLALGEKHPDVDKALEELRRYTGNAKATVTQLTKDYNAWLREVRQLRAFSDKDRDELREVMCRAGEYEMEQRVKEVADRWSSQISSVYGTVLGQSDRLGSRASDDKLKKYKGPKRVLEGLQANRANLEKLKNYELQGSNNPKIRAKLEYGKKVHADKQSSLCSGSGGYAELEISSSYCDNSVRPGSGCRADCVVTGSTCVIIEIKPDSDQAKSEGDRQRASYSAGLLKWYKSNKDELFNKYPQVRNCEQDGKELRVDSRPEIYSFCPSSSEAKAFGEDLRDAPSDIPESE